MNSLLIMFICMIVLISLISIPLAFYRKTRKKKYDVAHKKKDFFRCIFTAIFSILIVIGLNVYVIYKMIHNDPPFNLTVIGLVMFDMTFGLFIVISNIVCIYESINFLKVNK